MGQYLMATIIIWNFTKKLLIMQNFHSYYFRDNTMDFMSQNCFLKQPTFIEETAKL